MAGPARTRRLKPDTFFVGLYGTTEQFAEKVVPFLFSGQARVLWNFNPLRSSKCRVGDSVSCLRGWAKPVDG